MTDPIATRTTVATLDETARAAAFTEVYEGYMWPLVMGPAQMKAHIRTHDVAPDRSPLWLDGAGRLIGLGLVGLRGRQAWIGGFGIVPAWRGRGLALPLIEACLDQARSAGAIAIELEVLAGNDKARRTYERAGFRETGRLIGVKGAIPAGAAGAAGAEAAPLLDRKLRATCWQRAAPGLARVAALEAVALGNAFLLFTRTDDAIAIRHLAAEDPTTIAALLAATGGRTASLANEPQHSPALAGLLALGFEPFVEQHQMRRTLDGGAAS
jgi:RimJ/RimL family protein N-acetyltransferase